MERQCLMHAKHLLRARRVVSKSGEKNIRFTKLPQRSKRYISDFITTIINTRWRYVITAFLVTTFGCWIFFAMVWYLLAYAHNDLTFDPATGKPLHDGKMTCIRGVETLTAFFLYSFEIQTTVGFGERYPHDECPEAIFLFMIQIVVGVMLDTAMVGIIYAKLARPPRKPYDWKFSRKAVICQRDSKLCLMFRISDPKQVHLIGSKVQACLIGLINSTTGELVDQIQHQLKLQDDGQVLILFPLVVCHVIDSESPLYRLSAKLFLEKRFEIIVTFTGASPSTGQTTEERTSYLSSEILWGHRFVNLFEYDAVNEEYFADYDKFDETELVYTPLCSAQRLDQFREKIEKRDAISAASRVQHTNKSVK